MRRLSRRTFVWGAAAGATAGAAELLVRASSTSSAKSRQRAPRVDHHPAFSSTPRYLFDSSSEIRVLLDGFGAQKFYGLPDSIVVAAGTRSGNRTHVGSDTWVIVCRSGASEGSQPPYSRGQILCLTLPGGPDGVTRTSVVYRSPEGLDARQPGVCLLRDGRLCVAIGERSSVGTRQIAGGTVVIYSSDMGGSWSTPSAHDRPNHASRLGPATDLSGISGAVELGAGVVLCPWQGRAAASDDRQSSGYFVGTYRPGEPIYWRSSSVVVHGPEVGFDAVEPSLVVLDSTEMLFFARDNDRSMEYVCRSSDNGRRWSTPIRLVTPAPPGLQIYGGVHPAELGPNLLVATGRTYARHPAGLSGPPGGVIWSMDQGHSWKGPYLLESTTEAFGFDYGSVVSPPAVPNQLWVVMSTAASTSQANLVVGGTATPSEWV